VAGKRVLIAGLTLFTLITILSSALAQESETFVMDLVTVTSMASRAASPRFDMAVTLGQEVPVGGASLCNTGFVANLGFWSVLGPFDTPIVLQVEHGATHPANVELQWSGSSGFFTLYRSDLPDSVVAPPNVALTTPECAATDAPPEEVDLVYYLVLPTGGP
jgi:hypothetical protein